MKTKIRVILPARLRTNFFYELISPCGFDAYISKADFDRFYSSESKMAEKNKIKKKFMDLIEARYEIISIERFKINMYKHSHDLAAFISDYTQNTLLIVDEVHNMLSDKYDAKVFSEIMQDGVIKKRGKGMNTILFKVLTSMAHKSCKMVFMTATPIFDNINQFKELVRVMAPEAAKALQSNSKISQVIDILRGKVSFFPGTSVNAYPKVVYAHHDLEMSVTQDVLTAKINVGYKKSDDLDEFEGGDDVNDAEETEAFMVKRRQISIVAIQKTGALSKEQMDQILGNMPEYCPKIKKIVNLIETSVGKHVVYTNFVNVGINVLEHVLMSKGWVNFLKLKKYSKADLEPYKGKVYAVWSGKTKDVDKQHIKNVINAKDNIYGDKIRVIIGSPSIKEGVSFKHVQHLHLLDAVWNISAKDQVEGRAVRFCSHVDIKAEHDGLERKVIIHVYKMMPRNGGKVMKTCDQIIYDDIIPKKEKMVKAGESALRKVSIDHYLYRNLYPMYPNNPNGNSKNWPKPKYDDLGRSHIDLTEEEDILMKKGKTKAIKTTCPKPRRPDGEGLCKEGYLKKQNVHGDECCYKVFKGKGKAKKA